MTWTNATKLAFKNLSLIMHRVRPPGGRIPTMNGLGQGGSLSSPAFQECPQPVDLTHLKAQGEGYHKPNNT
jgi:hypothetical protein